MQTFSSYNILKEGACKNGMNLNKARLMKTVQIKIRFVEVLKIL